MRPLFNDLSVSHDEDAIRLPDGGEPVRNNKAGAALHHSGKRALHINFRACIDAARRFIQISIGGSVSITRAILNSWRCPWERLPPSSASTVS